MWAFPRLVPLLLCRVQYCRWSAIPHFNKYFQMRKKYLYLYLERLTHTFEMSENFSEKKGSGDMYRAVCIFPNKCVAMSVFWKYDAWCSDTWRKQAQTQFMARNGFFREIFLRLKKFTRGLQCTIIIYKKKTQKYFT